jgi:ubiquinone/menaquinone biosynthesis C-methylase UbiE
MSDDAPRKTGDLCPWWVGFLMDNWIRRLIHNPARILSPYVKPGMTAVDIGCGFGIFSIGMAKLVGPEGRVISVDVQQKMLDHMMKRARRAGVADRITPTLAAADTLGVEAKADFVLTFYMVHEVPDEERFLREIASILKPGGHYLLAEPPRHVAKEHYDETVAAAVRAGLVEVAAPRIRASYATVFRKP